MNYGLKENVYMVQGAINACIYDLNTKKLYAINPDMARALHELVCNNTIIHDSFEPIIEQLQEIGVLTLTEVLQPMKKITDIAEQKTHIMHSWIEVTKKCNLRCIHCYEESSPRINETMAMEDFKYIVGELKDAQIDAIQFIGGEPLILGDQLVEMIEYARPLLKYIEIFTNATLIDHKWIEIFKKYNITIRLSLHSHNEENHEKVTTVKKSYQDTLYAIELLRKNEIPYSISCILTNVNELGQSKSDVGINITKVDIVRMAGRASLKLLDRKLARQKLITQKSFTDPLNVDTLVFRAIQNFCFSTKIYIDTELNVYPCAMERRMMHGNIRHQSLKSILKDEIMYLTKDRVHECQDCEYRYACSDCRPDSLSEDIYSKPWYCTYSPQEGIWQDIEVFLNNLGL